jgi:integrase
MGSVFKPFVTRPLPEGAKLVTRGGKRVAVWTDASGKTHKAPVTAGGTPRLRERGNTYTAQFKGGDGVVRRVATGCKTLDAARAVLTELEARAEKVKAGIVTQAEANVAEHVDTPVVEHVDAYVAALARKRGKGAKRTVSAQHVENVDRTLRLAVVECGFRRLRDLHRDAVERWVGRLLDLPDDDVLDADGNVVTPRRPAARTINAKLATLTAWGTWLHDGGRLAVNPFAKLIKHVGLVEDDDTRRQRRALTADELRRLLTVARLRPVAQFGRPKVRIVDATRSPNSRATWKRDTLTFDTIAAAAERGRACMQPEAAEQFDRRGRERALIYLVLVTTGLRRGELAALTVGDVLPGADAKNGRRATLPLRADVAAELRAWIDDKAEAARRQHGDAVVVDGVPLFDVPDKLVRVLDRDLHAAGIPKRDARGRTVDVHAMRGTFASHLAAAGVAPTTLKTLMRHARIETTLKHYTDPALLDVAGAVEKLPALPQGAGQPGGSAVALGVALTAGRPRQNVALSDHGAGRRRRGSKPVIPEKHPGNTGFSSMGDIGLEPMTPSLSSGGTVVASAADKALTTRRSRRCTRRCTGSDTDAQRDALAAAGRMIAGQPLTDADRAAIVGWLVERAGRRPSS